MADVQFDARAEVRTLNSLIGATISDLNLVHPADYNNDIAHLSAEIFRLTPKQLQDTLAVMGPEQSRTFIKPWKDEIGTKSIAKDGNGNITEIIFHQYDGYFSESCDGTVDIDLKNKSVSTRTLDMVGKEHAQISKV